MTEPESVVAAPYPEKPDPQKDGVDHINVYSRAATPLGQALSNFANTPFRHPVHGNFCSMEGYWYWAASGMTHDNLRRMYGTSAKSVGSKLPIVSMGDEEFRDIIREGLICKISQTPALLSDFMSSTLPFRHYFVYGGRQDVVVEKENHRWQMEFLEQLRACLQSRAHTGEFYERWSHLFPDLDLTVLFVRK